MEILKVSNLNKKILRCKNQVQQARLFYGQMAQMEVMLLVSLSVRAKFFYLTCSQQALCNYQVKILVVVCFVFSRYLLDSNQCVNNK